MTLQPCPLLNDVISYDDGKHFYENNPNPYSLLNPDYQMEDKDGKSTNRTVVNCEKEPSIYLKYKIVSEYDQEIPQSQTADTTITRNHEDKQSKATSSLFPIEMIAKLEWTQSIAQRNIEQLQNPTMVVTI